MSDNKINVYNCPDGHQTITIDREKGTTSFIIACKECEKMAHSSMYSVPQDLTPTHEWVKLNDEELREYLKPYFENEVPDNWKEEIKEMFEKDPFEVLFEQNKEHSDLGGLFLREIKEEQP